MGQLMSEYWEIILAAVWEKHMVSQGYCPASARAEDEPPKPPGSPPAAGPVEPYA